MILAEGLDLSSETLIEILDNMPNGMVVKDDQHRWVLVNDALCRSLGRTRSDLVGRSDFDLLPPEWAERNWTTDDRVIQTGEPLDLESQIPMSDGEMRTVMTRKRRILLRQPGGARAPCVLVVIVDVTHIRKAEQNARFLALHDPLTRLANRLLFRERLEEALDQAAESSTKFGLLLFDLDGFKQINDRLGHLAGDQVLRVSADRLVGTIRKSDVIARLGGDEFGVLQVAQEQPGAAISLADRIAGMLSQPMQIFGSHVQITASVGIAIFPDDGHNADIIIHRADTAMYAVKRAGKNGYMACR